MEYKRRVITPQEAVSLYVNRHLDSVDKIKNRTGTKKWQGIKYGVVYELAVKQYAQIQSMQDLIDKQQKDIENLKRQIRH